MHAKDERHRMVFDRFSREIGNLIPTLLAPEEWQKKRELGRRGEGKPLWTNDAFDKTSIWVKLEILFVFSKYASHCAVYSDTNDDGASVRSNSLR